jgi:hypothetical protein
MRYRRWALNREIAKARERQLDSTRRKVERIAKHAEQKQVDDFPEVSSYLAGRFPSVDISDIKIYVASSEMIEKEGFKDMGGCYIDLLKVILVKNEIKQRNVRGKFKTMMHEVCDLKVDTEDIVVHELIHAISHKINRSSSRYRHMEEEFVYTNCIDFYKGKGMSEEDIVNNNFLPFTLYDVYGSRDEMGAIFSAVGVSLSAVQDMSKADYSRFLNKHAEVIVPMIKKMAQKRAFHMIELYHKYGVEMYQTSSAEPAEDPASLRFSALDLD